MSGQTITIIAVIAVTATITVLLRAFPFLLFSSGRKCPPVITYIGKVLSPAAIAMLVVYCLCSEYRGRSLADGAQPPFRIFPSPPLSTPRAVPAMPSPRPAPATPLLANSPIKQSPF